MKRSDMLQILEDSFNKHMNSDDHLDDKAVYDAILTDIEMAGILPEEIEWELEDNGK